MAADTHGVVQGAARHVVWYDTRYMFGVQIRLPWSVAPPRPQAPQSRAPRVVDVHGQTYPLVIARHHRARRYVLRMTTTGALRLTVPRGASIKAGLAFVRKQAPWIAREHARRDTLHRPWVDGTSIWFRGTQVSLLCDPTGVRLGAEGIGVSARGGNVRAGVEAWLRALAVAELPGRCLALATQHGLTVSRVSVRNQRSRWGSCSTRGTIALNWRLIQMPPEVSDYVILHELVHLKQSNHSRQFWREVASVCDGWREAERWLRQHGRELL